MATDWNEWHQHYDDPTGDLARRLDVVRATLREFLDGRGGADTVLVSMCAGDGRDTLPVLADGHRDVHAVLVELDPALARTAATTARVSGLTKVTVRVADAGSLATYADLPRADILLACGVFGNVTDDDLDRTVASLSRLLNDDAAVLWTRGDRRHDEDPSAYAGDPSDYVREVFARHGYREERFERPADAHFRVGLHRRTAAVAAAEMPGDRVLFRFTR